MNAHGRSRMPAPGLTPQVAPMGMSALIQELREFRADEGTKRQEYPWADRFVMGFPLPPWQRAFKWTEDQCRRFINSIWTGGHLGAYVLTEFSLRPEKDGFRGVEFEYLSNAVIDGQQRLKAIELFIEDRLAVPDSSGKLVLWSQVCEVDRRRFDRVIFSRGIVRERDELKLRELYDLMNFGGTPHEDNERALKQ